jgi:hypothetical protein
MNLPHLITSEVEDAKLYIFLKAQVEIPGSVV